MLILPVLIAKCTAYQVILKIHKILCIKALAPKPEQLARNRTWSDAFMIQVGFVW